MFFLVIIPYSKKIDTSETNYLTFKPHYTVLYQWLEYKQHWDRILVRSSIGVTDIESIPIFCNMQ